MPSDHPLMPFVRKLQRRKSLSGGDRAALLSLPYSLRQAGPGEYIVRDGEHPKHSCLLVSGFAFRQKIVGNGDRQILAVHMAGDMVDLQNSLLKKADHSVQALTSAQVACLPREAILRLATERPEIGRAMWLDTLVDGAIFREWIANVGRRDARMRLSHLLCEFAMRLEESGLAEREHYELPMTQEQLGDATGLTPVHVNRTLKALESDGLIMRTKRSVTIPDWRRLQEAGDFDQAYLHLDLAEDE